MSERIAVLGAGAWGTALAVRLAAGGAAVGLWARDAALADAEGEARQKAASAGAMPDSIVVTEREDVPLAFPGSNDRDDDGP